ncbi:hypothetical protein [Spirosoma aerolatum]|uniref:hypothetical protein n=1 Tax=Spirosoma aerolatum TaxID=1211326 RepID=UPI0009AC7785|nr:hypothetical protein [Spirosoma aerolatum]
MKTPILKTNQLPILNLRIDLVIGIDPDIDKSGWAVWSRSQNRFIEVLPLPFWKFIDKATAYAPGSALFVLDAGWLNEKVNYHAIKLPLHLKNASEAVKAKYVAAVREKVARDVGLNAGVGLSMLNFLQANHHEVRPIKPTMHKWDAEMIARQTGYKGQSNPETRDAMRLAWCYR